MTGISKSTLNNFNPRSREGSDVLSKNSSVCLLISIHAPAKGATASRMDCALRGCYFNPRSREGSDSSRGLYMFTFCVFQSTLPRRERQYRTFCNSFLHHFNPRSREGSDPFNRSNSRI